MQRQDVDAYVVSNGNRKITVYDVGGAIQCYKKNAGFFRSFSWQGDMSKLYHLYYDELLKVSDDTHRPLDATESFKVMSILVVSQIRQESASCQAIAQLEECYGEGLMSLCRLLCMHNALTERNFKNIYKHFDKILQIKTNVSYLIDANVAKPEYIEMICQYAPDSDATIPSIIKQYEGFNYNGTSAVEELKQRLSGQTKLSISAVDVQSTRSVHQLRELLGVPDNGIEMRSVVTNVSF